MEPPAKYGLPAKFASWRPGQVKAITDLKKCLKRTCIQVVPTGVGKSLIYMAGALQRCERTIILTSTKGLQSQLVSDFGVMGLVEVKGRKNYRCVRGDGPTADDGLCHLGVLCDFKAGGCPYYDALRAAKRARYVVTNYAMWLSAGDFLRDDTDMLIMDEAHAAPDHLSDHLSVEIDLDWMGEVLGEELREPESWPDWVAHWYWIVAEAIEEGLAHPDMNLRKLRQLHRVWRVIDNLRRISHTDFVVENVKGKFKIDPIKLKSFAEHYLFMGVPHLYLTSATVTAHTAEMLGLGDYWLEEYPSPFPVANRRVLMVPTVKVDRKMSQGEDLIWLARIDQIIRPRLDRKGIIHTVSYDRAWRIVKTSDYGKHAIVHGSNDAAMKVEAFKRRKPPAFLVSPSMSTGWDFPYDQCEWQIIAKVPFPDSSALIQQKRQELDPMLPFYLAWQAIVQASGRGCRAEDDRCETLIIDNHFQWLYRQYGHLAPKWFKEAIQFHKVLPAPLPKLEVVK